jgi:monoamine oxidase
MREPTAVAQGARKSSSPFIPCQVKFPLVTNLLETACPYLIKLTPSWDSPLLGDHHAYLTNMENRSCVVIGAGLSGLAAARVLAKERWKVTVLDARDRIGGRVFTYRFEDYETARHLYCELGGEWIGRGHKRMKALCKEFGLQPLLRHAFDFSFLEGGRVTKRFPVGAWPFSKKAGKAFDTLRDEAKSWSPRTQEILDRKDWWTILRDRGFTREELLRRDLMDSTDFGESIRQVGGFSAAAEYFSSNKNDEMDFRVQGGNIKVIEGLAKAVKRHGGSIHLKNEVRRIHQDHTGVDVEVSGKRRYRAAFSVCTVPVRTLTNIIFEPRLPDDQWDAAKQLQYARIMKTVLLFKERFWLKTRRTKFSCFTDGASDFIFDSSLYQPQPYGILCSYAIGDKADDLKALLDADPNKLKQVIERDLMMIFPGVKLNAVAIKAQPWQTDEYTQGAYAFYRPGQWFGIRATLQEPHMRVYFAGEHLAEEQGFMEGAVVTGEDAANNVLKASASDLLRRSAHPAIAPYLHARRNVLWT